MKRSIVLFALTLLCTAAAHARWYDGDYFRIEERQKRKVFISPDNKPFFPRGAGYACGFGTSTYGIAISTPEVFSDLKTIKKAGFNTVHINDDNPYLLDIILWCERNQVGVFIATDYPGEDYPDYMDLEMRQRVDRHYEALFKKIKKYRCIIAISVPQKPIFSDIDPEGRKQPSNPVFGKRTIVYLPRWLEAKYRDIKELNSAWKKNYAAFPEILTDAEVIKDWQVRQLETSPWRNDIAEYARWVESNFMGNLIAHIRLADRSHMVTYSIEAPQIVSLPTLREKNGYIDFISLKHREQGEAKGKMQIAGLIAQCKFYSDLTKTPLYFVETSFMQEKSKRLVPELTAAAKRDSARLHLRDSVLMPVLPFVVGWSYVAGFDSLVNSDFGCSENPNALVSLWSIINSRLPLPKSEPRPAEAVIYHPAYAAGSPDGSYPQYTSLMTLLEADFIDKFAEVCKELEYEVESPAGALNEKTFSKTSGIYKDYWYPFSFTDTIPDNNKPLLLAGSGLKQLSHDDRGRLSKSFTVTFGEIGTRDHTLQSTEPWFLYAAGVKTEEYTKQSANAVHSYFQYPGKERKNEKCAQWDGDFAVYRDKDGSASFLQCQGQILLVSSQSYTSFDFLIASKGDDACEQVEFLYTNNSSDKKYIGPTIPSWQEKPAFGHLAMTETIEGRPAYLTHFTVLCNAMKTLYAVRLPDNPDICVFSIMGNVYGTVRNCGMVLTCEDSVVMSTTPWLILVDKNRSSRFTTLEYFDNGCPAIIKSKKGRHTAFLYDVLSQGNAENNDYARQLAKQTEILKKILGGW